MLLTPARLAAAGALAVTEADVRAEPDPADRAGLLLHGLLAEQESPVQLTGGGSVLASGPGSDLASGEGFVSPSRRAAAGCPSARAAATASARSASVYRRRGAPADFDMPVSAHLAAERECSGFQVMWAGSGCDKSTYAGATVGAGSGPVNSSGCGVQASESSMSTPTWHVRISAKRGQPFPWCCRSRYPNFPSARTGIRPGTAHEAARGPCCSTCSNARPRAPFLAQRPNAPCPNLPL